MKRKQLVLNIGANVLSVLIGLFISFFLTPFIVQNIGKEAYSFVPISNNFASYLSIMTIALTSMTSRFITMELYKNNVDSANEYLSTSFYTNIVVAIFTGILSILIIFFLEKIINIPFILISDVRLLFIFILSAFVINVSTTTFSVAAFCTNRLDISSLVSISGSIARVITIFILFRYFEPKIYYIGISVLVVVIIQGIMNFVLGRKILPVLHISIRKVKAKIIYELFNSGVWNSFNQLSYVLLTGLDLVIANIMISASASGILAISKTAPLALQTLISVLPNTFNPYLTILYAKNNKPFFLKELFYILKFCAILIGIPIASFIVLSSSFFQLWVPSVVNNQMIWLSILTMVSMVASFSVMPLIFIFAITNRLKWPSIAIFTTGILNIIVVFGLLKTTNFGLYAIAGVSSFIEIFRNLLFVPMYASHCLQVNKFYFFKFISRSLSYFAILIIVYYGISKLLKIDTWSSLLLVICLMIIVGIFIGYYFMLNNIEKEKFVYIIRSIIKQRVKG